MEALTKLRGLIHDKLKKVFTDDELTEYMTDSNNNVYRAAALCLTVVIANPDKLAQYGASGLNLTYQDLTKAIALYKQQSGSGIGSVSLEKEY
jgi:hypothetical protein